MQNKLHWAFHGQTAAEVIVDRAYSEKGQMGLHSRTDSPHGKIQLFDVVVAKNYLTQNEMAQLSLLVNAYLDVAEDTALRKIPMTMQDWGVRLNRFLAATDREVLSNAGKVSAEIPRASLGQQRCPTCTPQPPPSKTSPKLRHPTTNIQQKAYHREHSSASPQKANRRGPAHHP